MIGAKLSDQRDSRNAGRFKSPNQRLASSGGFERRASAAGFRCKPSADWQIWNGLHSWNSFGREFCADHIEKAIFVTLASIFSETAPVIPYLETLDQPLRSFVGMANRNECFSDFSKQKTAKERWHSLVSRMGDREEYLETPLPLPRVCTDVRTFARSYADVITKFSRLDGLPIFLSHGASRVSAASECNIFQTREKKNSYLQADK